MFSLRDSVRRLLSTTPCRSRQTATRLTVETLETRQLLSSFALSNAGVLTQGSTVVDQNVSSFETDGLYSVGVTAYWLLTGVNPFDRPSSRAILRAHLVETPLPLIDVCPHVDVDLHTVVMTCLEKDPRERFPSARALEEALAGCSAAGKWTEREAAAWWQQQQNTGKGDAPERG